MDIDTDWCLNCGKQTNGELYCSSQCRNQDEKGLKPGNAPSFDFGSYHDHESVSSGRSSPVFGSSPSSKYLNNPDKLLYYQSYDLKFKNRPSYDAGYYSPCLSSGLSQWLNQNVKMMSSQEQSKKSLMRMASQHVGHKHHPKHVEFTNGFRGSFSSASSESSYSSASDTVIFDSSSSSSSSSPAVKDAFYPWSKLEEDEEISLYEY